MALDIFSELKQLSVSSHAILQQCAEQQKSYFTWLDRVVENAKEVLDRTTPDENLGCVASIERCQTNSSQVLNLIPSFPQCIPAENEFDSQQNNGDETSKTICPSDGDEFQPNSIRSGKSNIHRKSISVKNLHTMIPTSAEAEVLNMTVVQSSNPIALSNTHQHEKGNLKRGYSQNSETESSKLESIQDIKLVSENVVTTESTEQTPNVCYSKNSRQTRRSTRSMSKKLQKSSHESTLGNLPNSPKTSRESEDCLVIKAKHKRSFCGENVSPCANPSDEVENSEGFYSENAHNASKSSSSGKRSLKSKEVCVDPSELCYDAIQNSLVKSQGNSANSILSTPISALKNSTNFQLQVNGTPLVKTVLSSTHCGKKKVVVSTKASKHCSKFNNSSVSSAKASGKHFIHRKSRPGSVTSSVGKSFLQKYRSVHQEEEKEKIRLDELKKQERDEAVGKKMALLKLKAEEQKRKREYKMEKNLLARQQMEREKEERFKHREQSKEEKLALVEKELQKKREENKNKKRKLMGGTDSDQPDNKCDDLKKKQKTTNKPLPEPAKSTPSEKLKISESENEPVKTSGSSKNQKSLNSTYVTKNTDSSDSYSMTPLARHSSYSNYDISELRQSDESDDEPDPSKQIPAWASGIRLKEAIIKQSYYPPDLDALFKEIVIGPNEFFGMKKRKHLSRTSSAIWATPDRP